MPRPTVNLQMVLSIYLLLVSLDLLADGYILVGSTGTDIHTVQELVENHLKEMILKHFDTKKADAIFADGEVSCTLTT